MVDCGHAVRHRLEFFLFESVRLAVRLLPRRLLLATGSALGRLAFRLDRRHREIALDNLRTAFPALAPEEAREIARRSFAFFARYVFDLVSGLPAFPLARLLSFEHEGLDHVTEAAAEGKGVLYFTGHFGAWEMMALTAPARGYPLGVIARPLDNPYLDRQITALRTSTGNVVIDKRDGFRPMLRTLREGKGIAILIDQNVIGEERIFVDFFGRPASTTPALALLHLKTGAPLIPVFAFPAGEDGYRFAFGPRVRVPLSGNRREDVLRITEACTRVLEKRIREEPALWLWMHRRWKTRPA